MISPLLLALPIALALGFLLELAHHLRGLR
jgi:hypothetical protein